MYKRQANGGVIYEYGNEYIVRGVLSSHDVAQLSRSVIKTVEGVHVTLEDIADVKIGSCLLYTSTANEVTGDAIVSPPTATGWYDGGPYMHFHYHDWNSEMCIRDRFYYQFLCVFHFISFGKGIKLTGTKDVYKRQRICISFPVAIILS